jgi:hypothetical protein
VTSFPFPRRLFLDSGVVQLYFDYSGAIFDGCTVGADARIRRMPEGLAHLEGLRLLAIVNQRGAFHVAVSESSFVEAEARLNPHHTAWLNDLAVYWQETLAAHEQDPFSGSGAGVAEKLAGKSFGYLGAGDRALLREACLLECDAFLTVDSRLARNALHLERELGIKMMTPAQLERRLAPWAALF